MSRMALAAAQGGAVGIRANSVVDIRAIKESVSLPVIGIIKRDYPGSDVFITATLQEVDELMTVEPEIIALDATARPRRWTNAGRISYANPRSLPVCAADGGYRHHRRGGDS